MDQELQHRLGETTAEGQEGVSAFYNPYPMFSPYSPGPSPGPAARPPSTPPGYGRGSRGAMPGIVTQVVSECSRELMRCFRQAMDEFKSTLTLTRRPGYLEQTNLSSGRDLFTPTAVTLPAGGGPVTLLDFTVPTSHVFIVDRFANELENPMAFADVRWSIFKAANEHLEPAYNSFQISLGLIANPTHFSIFHVLDGRFIVTADNIGAVDHQALTRALGWLFPVDSVQDTPAQSAAKPDSRGMDNQRGEVRTT